MGLILSCIIGVRHDRPSRREMGVHRKKHRILLLKNALPVFVAASISRAILAVILEISDGNVSSILAAFVYTFVICHTTGVVLTVLLPQDMIMIHYFHHVITETVGFAWKESALLLVIDQIGSWGIGIGTWCAFVFFALFFVSVSTLLCVRLQLSPAIERAVTTFTSEVFALSIAYTFTVIIAYIIYWQQRDDSSVYSADDNVKGEESDDESEESTNITTLNHGLFLGYSIALTYLIALISSYNEDKYVAVDSLNQSVAVSDHSLPTSNDIANSILLTTDTISIESEQSKQDNITNTDTEFEAELNNRDQGYTSSGVVMARYLTWDEYFHIHSALFNLVQTIEG